MILYSIVIRQYTSSGDKEIQNTQNRNRIGLESSNGYISHSFFSMPISKIAIHNHSITSDKIISGHTINSDNMNSEIIASDIINSNIIIIDINSGRSGPSMQSLLTYWPILVHPIAIPKNYISPQKQVLHHH